MPPRKLTEEQLRKRKEQILRWQQEHKDSVNERHRKWYAENIEQERQRSREKIQRQKARDPEAYNAYMRAWRYKNIEQCRAVEWARTLRKNYNLTVDKYQELVDAAKGKCQICGREFGKKGPAVDHCHNTNMVRGIICQKCNTAEGLMETPENVLKLYNYMKKNELFYKNGGSSQL